MKGTVAFGFAMLGLALALGGCPPAGDGSAAPATATTTSTEVGGSAAASAAPTTAAAAEPDATVLADCMDVGTKVYGECAADAAAMAVEMRLKSGTLPPEAVEKAKTPDGKAALVAASLEEMKTNMADPAKNKEFCAAMATKMVDTMKADHDALAACLAKTDCKERVACFGPIAEKHSKEITEKMGDMMKKDAAPGAAAPAAGAPPAK